MRKDYNRLSIAIVKNLRGKRTQNQMSKRLGYSYNQVNKWESGVKRIKWIEFVNFTNVMKFDLKSVLLNTMTFYGDLLDTKGLYHRLVFDRSVSEIAAMLSKPEAAIRRWSRGDQEFILADCLEMLDKFLNVLPSFLSFFPSIDLPPDFSHINRDLTEIKETYKNPVVSGALYCLKLDSYKKRKKHVEGFIAKQVGISLDQEREFIRQFEKAGIIEKENGLYVIKRKDALDFRMDDSQFNSLVTYWLNRGIQKIESRLPEANRSIKGYHVFPISKEGFKKVEELTFAYYNQLVALVNSDTHPSEFIAAMTIVTFDASK